MNENEAWFLSKVVAGMVLVLGLFVYWSLSSEYQEDLLLDYSGASNRKPASLVKISDLKHGIMPSGSVMSTIDLNCVDNSDTLKLKSHSQQLRLVGRFCDKTTNADDTEIKQLLISNTSNGFDATIFNTPNGGFTTDYVYLRKGKNRVVVSVFEGEDKNIQTLKEIVIEKTDKLVLDDKTPSATGSM